MIKTGFIIFDQDQKPKTQLADTVSWQFISERIAVMAYQIVAVTPALQNQGLAQQLVAHILGVLRQRGYKSVHIIVNRGNIKAIRSYAHIGLCMTGECYMYHQHFLCYEKPL